MNTPFDIMHCSAIFLRRNTCGPSSTHARQSVTERRAVRQAVWLKPEWHELMKKPLQIDLSLDVNQGG